MEFSPNLDPRFIKALIGSLLDECTDGGVLNFIVWILNMYNAMVEDELNQQLFHSDNMRRLRSPSEEQEFQQEIRTIQYALVNHLSWAQNWTLPARLRNFPTAINNYAPQISIREQGIAWRIIPNRHQLAPSEISPPLPITYYYR